MRRSPSSIRTTCASSTWTSSGSVPSTPAAGSTRVSTLFYVPVLLGGFFPWSALLPATLRATLRPRASRRRRRLLRAVGRHRPPGVRPRAGQGRLVHPARLPAPGAPHRALPRRLLLDATPPPDDTRLAARRALGRRPLSSCCCRPTRSPPPPRATTASCCGQPLVAAAAGAGGRARRAAAPATELRDRGRRRRVRRRRFWSSSTSSSHRPLMEVRSDAALVARALREAAPDQADVPARRLPRRSSSLRST